jgi:hypothetical protein
MVQQDACCIHMITLGCHMQGCQPILQQDNSRCLTSMYRDKVTLRKCTRYQYGCMNHTCSDFYSELLV